MSIRSRWVAVAVVPRVKNLRHIGAGSRPDALGDCPHPRCGKRFEVRDLALIPLWLVMKPAYALAPIALLFRVATLRGTLDWWTCRSRAELLEVLERHLDEADGGPSPRRVARRYHQFRRRGALARHWPQLQRFAGVERVEIDGLEHLDKALSRGQGAILVTAHYGYARLIKPILRSTGRPALLVGPSPQGRGPQDFPPFFTRFGSFVHTRLLNLPHASSLDGRWRDTVGVDLPAELNLRPHVAALKRNETLIILTDGRSVQALWPVPVLGIEVSFASGAVSIARRAGAAVLPTFVVDDPERPCPSGLRLVICPPIDLQVSGDASADSEVNLGRFAEVYEQQVRRHPHNWHWSWVSDGAFARPQ